MKPSEFKKGEKYIRIIPYRRTKTSPFDWSFTNSLMVFDEISTQGNLIMHREDNSLDVYSKPSEIPFHPGWRPESILSDGPKTDLSQWEGKLITQIKPIFLAPIKLKLPCYQCFNSQKYILNSQAGRFKTQTFSYDKSYINCSIKLISATKYHLVIEKPNGKRRILDSRYVDIENWALA